MAPSNGVHRTITVSRPLRAQRPRQAGPRVTHIVGRHERDNDSPTAVTVDNVRSRIMFSLYQQALSTPR